MDVSLPYSCQHHLGRSFQMFPDNRRQQTMH